MPSPFVDDKQMFFQSVDQLTIDQVSVRAKGKDLSFLTMHRQSIEHEFNNLNAVLKTNEDKYLKSLLYMASMLKNYHDAENVTGIEAIQYSELCDAIKKRIAGQAVVLPNKKTLVETFARDVSDLSLIPFSNEKLRKLSGKANLQRLSTRFSMITVQQTLLLANQYHYLDSLEVLMGRQVNIAILDAPIGVYNALSVGLFGFRFLLNLSMLLKRTFTPVDGLTMGEVFNDEFKKRYYQMTNDLVWGVVNGLSNYATYFHIAAPVTGYLMIGFTVFDIIWLYHLLDQTDRNFLSKKQEYLEYQALLEKDSPEYLMVQKQLDQLALDHEKARSEVVFYFVAAIIFLSSFTTMFLFAPAALVPVFFLVCNIAIAMYMSGAQYGEYKEKCLVVEQQKTNTGDVTTEARKDVQTAWDNLGFAMAKNTIAPLVILGAFTINFPAAILLTLTYMAYESGYLTRLPELFVGSKEPEVEAPTLN